MSQERMFPESADADPAVTSPAVRKTRPDEARVYKAVRNQVEMMLRDLDSILPEDHLARAIWAGLRLS